VYNIEARFDAARSARDQSGVKPPHSKEASGKEDFDIDLDLVWPLRIGRLLGVRRLDAALVARGARFCEPKEADKRRSSPLF